MTLVVIRIGLLFNVVKQLNNYVLESYLLRWYFDCSCWMTAESAKSKEYWMDEIAFLEARLNGSQGDIDSDDRKACEVALKLAQGNLLPGQ